MHNVCAKVTCCLLNYKLRSYLILVQLSGKPLMHGLHTSGLCCYETEAPSASLSYQHLHSAGQARLHLVSWHLPESESVALKTLIVQSPNRLGEISEAGGLV
jgi:hypothetical protein